ncbi:MAG: 3-oxoacyl-(acyl-carrier-protein) reductase [Evtepia sp.]|jgi:3-oxoacyl-[acyl-carrier protein] reductase|nr:3-oxoacyl-(acyl-carrier-protein) reductase [Evtepia sp.]
MLKGKVAIITGASRGIGRAIAVKFAQNGADVAILYASNDAAAEAVMQECRSFGVRAAAYRCDVADFTACKEVVSLVKTDFGKVDLLVNNAGITRDGLIATMKEADFDAVLDTNLKGAFHMIRHCCSLFIRAKGGKIINISSVSGLLGNAGQANYSASKAGLIGLTKSVARELAPRNITCNAIAPGFIQTDMTQDLDAGNAMASTIPLGRLGSPEDVANAALFLASNSADYITGEVLRVDGGLAM